MLDGAIGQRTLKTLGVVRLDCRAVNLIGSSGLTKAGRLESRVVSLKSCC